MDVIFGLPELFKYIPEYSNDIEEEAKEIKRISHEDLKNYLEYNNVHISILDYKRTWNKIEELMKGPNNEL